MLDPEALTAIVGLIVINVVLSGDNAVVIGLAAHRLPPAVRRRAIVYGSAGAIGLRVVFTGLAAYLLQLPLLQLVGGVLLVWIAYKLLRPEDDSAVEALAHDTSARDAIQTIVLADLVMSLDNVLAIGGASHGDVWLMIVGLAISMPLIAVGGGLVAWLMNTVPWLVYVGAAILAWTAGEMVLSDSIVEPRVADSAVVSIALPLGLTLVVLAAGWLTRRAVSRRVAPEG